MAVYEYIALDVRGKRVKGIIDAESVVSARQRLQDLKTFPIDISETSADGQVKTFKDKSVGSFLKSVGPTDISVMTRQLSTLLNAGIPLISSLSALVLQTQSPKLKKIVAQVKEEVNKGNGLADSIRPFEKIFPPFYVNMVRAGEASGTLDTVFERLAAFTEREQALRGRIKAALAYPLFMFAIGSLVLFFLATFIIPRITSIFEEMNQTLPGITLVLISVSGFLKSYWFFLLTGLVAGYILIRHLTGRTERGKYTWDRIKLTLPLFGPLYHKIVVSQFTRTLGTLLKSGVPLLTSLSIVSNIVNNRLIADTIENARLHVEKGHSLAVSLSHNGLFPPLVIHMITVGEQSGTLEDMLFKVSDSYEEEAESKVLVLTSLLEPVMILVMGLLVGFIVVSILLPIFEMNQLIR